MNTVKLRTFAKLNLTLDILGKEGEYHLLDSLVTTVDLSDRIVAKKRKDGLISVTMHGMGSESIPPERNNAWRAGEAFVSAFSTTGADIDVYKDIPIGAGLGGSSADAAGVLNALSMLYGISAPLKELADSLGSDTGYLLRGGFARMRGRGDQVEFLGDAPDLHILLLCPPEGVSTAECYKICDTYTTFSSSPEGERGAGRTARALECFRTGNIEWAAKLLGNDLYPAATKLNPEVKEALSCLKALSPWGAGMTGSGSGVFALFETRELCEWAKSRYCGNCRAYVLKTAGARPEEVAAAE